MLIKWPGLENGEFPRCVAPGGGYSLSVDPALAWLLDRASHGAWASPGAQQPSVHAAALRTERQGKANPQQTACTEQMSNLR